MRAYSLDLRERIVGAVASGLSKAEVARRFAVDVSTVKRYVQRQAAGDLVPRRSPGRPRRIGRLQEPALQAQVARHDTATLAEHCRTWADEQGAAVSTATMCRALKLEFDDRPEPIEEVRVPEGVVVADLSADLAGE